MCASRGCRARDAGGCRAGRRSPTARSVSRARRCADLRWRRRRKWRSSRLAEGAASSRYCTAQRFRLLDQLAEPLREIRLVLLDGQRARPHGHLQELIDERAKVLTDAEAQERRRLVLDGLERLQRLRVLARELGGV